MKTIHNPKSNSVYLLKTKNKSVIPEKRAHFCMLCFNSIADQQFCLDGHWYLSVFYIFRHSSFQKEYY